MYLNSINNDVSHLLGQVLVYLGAEAGARDAGQD